MLWMSMHYNNIMRAFKYHEIKVFILFIRSGIGWKPL